MYKHTGPVQTDIVQESTKYEVVQLQIMPSYISSRFYYIFFKLYFKQNFKEQHSRWQMFSGFNLGLLGFVLALNINPNEYFHNCKIIICKIRNIWLDIIFSFFFSTFIFNIVVVFAIHWHKSAMAVQVFPILNPHSHLPPHPIPQGHPSAPALSTLSHASNLDWWSVSHMIIYMFQCYALRSSQPRLLPLSPKDCSIHLCLFCYLAYRVIITIFLNSIYMH